MKKRLPKVSKIPTVTVAVSAYNEAANIQAFLISVLSQKETQYRLKKILVISDGSTDSTAAIARSLGSKKIVVKTYRGRLGKSNRLNQIYAKVESDILVQSDVDVVFSHPNVITKLISPLLKKKPADMCGGNPLPLPAATFVEKAINTTVATYLPFRSEIKGGNNIFSADGRLLAFKKKVYRELTIPTTMIANDAYAYFFCISRGYKYAFVKQATVWYRSPQTLSDHIRQNVRFNAAPLRMERYFPKSLVQSEYAIPTVFYLKNAIKQFLQSPFHVVFITLVNIYCRIEGRKSESLIGAKWPMAISTKTLTTL